MNTNLDEIVFSNYQLVEAIKFGDIQYPTKNYDIILTKSGVQYLYPKNYKIIYK